MKVKTDCFAYKIKINKKKNDIVEYCDALTSLECEKCNFYKRKESKEKSIKTIPLKQPDHKPIRKQKTPDDYANRILSDVKYWEERNKYY